MSFGATAVAIPTAEPTAFRVRAQARSSAVSGWREALVPAAASGPAEGNVSAFAGPVTATGLRSEQAMSARIDDLLVLNANLNKTDFAKHLRDREAVRVFDGAGNVREDIAGDVPGGSSSSMQPCVRTTRCA